MGTADRHDRFDALAVGHVLGGLEPDDAASFRGHLIACDVCRRRVAELRGIAADLAVAEREERARITTKTAVARREETAPVGPSTTRSIAWLIVAAVGVMAVLALLFWAFHLRQVNTTLTEVAAVREAVLSGMATGDAVALELADGIEGQVVIDDQGQLVGTLAGLPITGSNQRVIAWLLGPSTGDAAGETLLATPVDVTTDGLGAFRLQRSDGARVVVSLESMPPGAGPTGRTLAEADLS